MIPLDIRRPGDRSDVGGRTSVQDLQQFFSYFDEPVDVGAVNLIVR